MTTLGTGVVAGLAIAMPLGAIAVLLIQEGATRGFRRGVPASAAVATVDTLYCVVAVVARAVIAPVVASWGPWPKIVGGGLLIALAFRGLLSLRRGSTAADPAGSVHDSSVRRYALFFGLTAINPATLVYFAAVVAGLGGVAESPATVVVFTLGVGGASLGWQIALVACGALLHGRTSFRGRIVTALIGNGIVAAFGVVMVATAFTQ